MRLHEQRPPELRDPQRVAAGKASALKRWGPPRVARLDSLDSVTAGIIRTILAGRAHAAEADEFTPDERSLADAVVKAVRKRERLVPAAGAQTGMWGSAIAAQANAKAAEPSADAK